MKMKYLMIVALVLAILTIGVASASEDVASDDLAVDDGVDEISAPLDDGDVIADSEDSGDDSSYEKEEADYECDVPEEVHANDLEDTYIHVKVSNEDATGNITIKIDDETVYNQEVIPYVGEDDDIDDDDDELDDDDDELDDDDDLIGNYDWDDGSDDWDDEELGEGGNYFYFSGLDLKQGYHYVEISYTGDENYEPFTVYESFYYYLIDVEIKDEAYYGFYVEFVDDATGTFEVLLNDKFYGNYTVDDIWDNDGYIDLDDLEYGHYTYNITYSGDEKYVLDEPFTGEFNWTYRFFVDVYVDDEDYIFIGDDVGVCIGYPFDADGELTVTCNGRLINKTTIFADEYDEGEIYLEISNLSDVENVINFTYTDSKYPQRSIVKTVTAYGKLTVPNGKIRYNNEDDAISILLPSDAEGNLTVSIWDDCEGYVVFKQIPVENGKATYLVNDLGLGYQDLRAYYDGEDYSGYVLMEDGDYPDEFYIYIIPDVQYSENIYVNSENNITIVLPDDFNSQLIVTVHSEEGSEDSETSSMIYDFSKEIYNNDEANGTVIIPLGDLDVGEYVISVSYSCYEDDYPLNVRGTDPKFDLNITFPSELTDDNEISISNVPDDIDGQFDLYIDDELYDGYFFSYDEFDKLVPFSSIDYEIYGNHTWEIKFHSDSYYENASTGGMFFRDWVYINSILYTYNNIYVNVGDREGYVEVKFDGELYDTEILYDGHTSFSLDELAPGNHTYEISYYDEDNVKQLTKSGSFKLDYEIWTNIDNPYVWSNEFDLKIDMPDDANGMITINLNGMKYNVRLINGSASITFNKKLVFGENNITIRFNGDSKYPAKTIEDVINVTGYGFKIVYTGEDYEYFDYVSILLPDDAEGDVVAYFTYYDDYEDERVIDYDKDPISFELENGFAKITPADFDFGEYELLIRYDACDYDVDDVYIYFENNPEINITDEIIMGENATISVEIPGATGNLTIYKRIGYDRRYNPIWELFDNITSDNGKFEKQIAGLPLGQHEFYFEYVGDDRENMFDSDDSYYIYVTVKNVAFPDEFDANGTGEIAFELPDGAKGIISVDLWLVDDDEGYEVIPVIENETYTSANKTIQITAPSPGYYIIILKYADEKYGQDIFEGHSRMIDSDEEDIAEVPETISGDTLEITFPENATGKVLVTIDGESTIVDIVGGVARVNVSQLSSGKHDVSIKYAGDENFPEFEKSCTLTKSNGAAPSGNGTTPTGNGTGGNPSGPGSNPSGNGTGSNPSGPGSNPSGNGTGSNPSGTGDNPSGNGTGSNPSGTGTDLPDNSTGSQNGTSGNDGLLPPNKTNTTTTNDTKTDTTQSGVNPAVNPRISANDLTAYYNKASYSVTVYGSDGKVASGVTVTFKVNGKKVGTATTNANGVATITLKQTPKTYKITSEALGAKQTKTLKIKQVLTLKKVKVKKSAKKLVLKATLKQGKKALKNKKIVFKFNGKKIGTAKTNKKGVAKITVKKKYLKKLKKGKKVKYQATYLKDTVKKSVKVQK